MAETTYAVSFRAECSERERGRRSEASADLAPVFLFHLRGADAVAVGGSSGLGDPLGCYTLPAASCLLTYVRNTLTRG